MKIRMGKGLVKKHEFRWVRLSGAPRCGGVNDEVIGMLVGVSERACLRIRG